MRVSESRVPAADLRSFDVQRFFIPGPLFIRGPQLAWWLLGITAALLLAMPLRTSGQNAPAVNSAVNTPAAPANHAVIAENYGRLPLSFEANQGQTAPQVRFLSRGNGYSLFLTNSEAVLALRKPGKTGAKPSALPGKPGAQSPPSFRTDVVRMQLAGASSDLRVSGADQLPGTANYFIGNDAKKWHRGIPTYGKVKYTGVYPGVDLVYYGNQNQLEYDFVVVPGAEIKPIRLRFAGVERLKLDSDGDLEVIAKNGEIAFHKPFVYQDVNGQRQRVEGRFALLAKNTVGFALGSYDRSRALIIDPTLAYSTYLGGTGAGYGTAIAVDAEGEAYVTGTNSSSNFPTTGNAYSSSGASFITKLNADGTSLIYSTYFGGSNDYPTGISIDGAGNAYVAGNAFSTDFPVTTGAFQTVNKGGANQVSNGFVIKLNATGTALVYSTYLGGSGLSGYAGIGSLGEIVGGDGCSYIAVDASGNAYVTGTAFSTDFPVTGGSLQGSNKSASSKLPNSFVTKLNPEGTALVYSTYLGGSRGDEGSGIAVDSDGNAYAIGGTYSTDFPVTGGALQNKNNAAANGFSNGFLAKLNMSGSALVYATYLGGSGDINGPADNNNGDAAFSVAVDSSGNAYLSGLTQSSDFPVTAGAFQNANLSFSAGLGPSYFVSKINPSGTGLVYSTYLGSSVGDGNAGSSGMALDSQGNIYLTGFTLGTDFPVTANAFQTVNNCGIHHLNNVFFTELNSSGSGLVYSTYLGGTGYPFSIVVNGISTTAYYCDMGYGVSLDGNGNAYLTGSAASPDFPITAGAYQTAKAAISNVYISKFALNAGTIVAPTTTMLTADVNPQTVGTKVTFTADVAPVTGTGVPTGTVTFSIDGGAGMVVNLDDTGHASYATSTLSAGTHTIKASYSGNMTYSASSGTLTETIVGAAASISAVSGSGQSATSGSAFANPLVAIVKDANGNPIPGVIVSFSGTGLSFSSSAATTGSNGEASVTATPTTTGSFTATATTSGVTSSATFSLTGNAAALPTAATPAFSPAAGTYTAAQTVTISDTTAGATIYYTTNGSMPTASSTKYTGAITVSSTETLEAIAVASGYTNSTVAMAAYTINIAPPPAASFTLAVSPSSASVSNGQSANFTLTVTPQNGFTQAVSFSCSGLPAGDTCSFSLATLTPAAAPVTSALTIATSATPAAASLAVHPLPLWAKLTGGICVALLLWPFRRRRVWPIAAAILLLAAGFTSVGCGGSSKMQAAPVTVTVTATGGGISQTGTIQLTVTN